MSDIYSSKFPLIFALGKRKDWAITLGQRTWYSVPESHVSASWRRHEEKHKEQWRRERMLKFAVKYLWYLARYGYHENPFEVEARAAEAAGA